MSQTESIALLSAVLVVGYWLGKRQAQATVSNTQASSNGLDWLSSWATS